MLLVGLIILLSWITRHAGATFRREQAHTGSQMVTWEAELKLKTTLVTKYGLLKLDGDHRKIVDFENFFFVYCAAINATNMDYYGTESKLTQWSPTVSSQLMSLNMNTGMIDTNVYSYSLVDSNIMFHDKKTTIKYFQRSNNRLAGANTEYEAFDNSTLGVVTVGNHAIEAKLSNSTGVWEAVGILAHQFPFRMRKNYFQMTLNVGHVIMETLKIDDWEPFFWADIGDYTAAIASKVNVNVSYDSPTNTYNATIFTAFTEPWRRQSGLDNEAIEPLANLIINDAKMEAAMPKHSWQLAYYYSRNLLSLRTKEEHMAVGANELTLEMDNQLLAVQYNNDHDDIMISCYKDLDFVKFDVYRDGLYVGILSDLFPTTLTYNRTANQITFQDIVSQVVHSVKIDLTTNTMETIPIFVRQDYIDRNTTIYMPYEIQTGIKTSWTNWNTLDKTNHILITQHFVDLRVSQFQLQINRITGEVTTDVGVADWSADGSFSAKFGDLRANVKPSASDRRQVDWMDASGKHVRMNLSPDGVMNAYYNGDYDHDGIHLQSNRNFTMLKFNEMVAKIIRKS